jgi:FMN-dependent NADH-azoreductase
MKQKKILYIEASPRKIRSFSKQMGEVFLEVFLTHNRDYELDIIDLWNIKLPEFDETATIAKYKFPRGLTLTNGEIAVWEDILELFDRFNSADKYVFSVPMWNFFIPYKLKHFIDLLVQPGLSFEVSPEGEYSGLVKERPAMLLLSRGGDYSSADMEALDFQRRYLYFILKFIGFEDIREVVAQPMNADNDKVAAIKSHVEAEVARVAAEF